MVSLSGAQRELGMLLSGLGYRGLQLWTLRMVNRNSPDFSGSAWGKGLDGPLP